MIMEICIESALIVLIASASIVSVSCTFCPEEMFWDICGHHECRFSCTHPLGPKGCIPKCGPPGCTCFLHLVMRETDRKCVKKEECPSSLTTVPLPKVTPPVPFGKCPEGMFLDVCGHHKCRFSCTHPLGPKGCIPKCGPPGCTCLLHLVMRETDGKCVKKEECTTYNPPPYPPQTKQPYPPQPGPPYPPQTKQPYPPQPGPPYPPQTKQPYPPQPGSPYPPQTKQLYPPQPGPPYPPQTKQPYPPQPGPQYPDKSGSPKIPSNIKLSSAPYGVELPPKKPSYPQRVSPHTGKFSRKYKDSGKHSSGGSPQRIRGRKCPHGRFSYG